MREILFRGKRTDTKEWVEGFYVHFVDSWKNCETHRIYLKSAETDCGDYYPDWYEVDPETVGQFTGLTDKNGKKIFEGDIIKRTFEHIGTQYAEIGWAEKYASFKICPYKDWQYTDIKDCEKVGNIYDNPEYWKKRQSGKVIHDNGKFVAVEITK